MKIPAWLRWLLDLGDPPTDDGGREYEFRNADGSTYHRARSRNACLFRLETRAHGKTNDGAARSRPSTPQTQLTLHVVGTGEVVATELGDSDRAVRLWNNPDAAWFRR